MTPIAPRQTSAAFSLLEVTIALGLGAFCLLAILGLLQTGLTSEKATLGQTAASNILSTVFSDIISTPANLSTSRIFHIPLDTPSSTSPRTIYFSEAAKPTGAIGAAPTADSQYRVSIGITPAPSTAKAATTARILVTWPAAADPLPNQWPAKASGAVEVVTALDRN